MEGYAHDAPWYQASDIVALEIALKGGFEKIKFNGTLNPQDLQYLCGWLKGVDKEKIEGLRLPACLLKRQEMMLLIESLSQNHSIKWLELSFNTSFDKDGWESLSQYVSKNEVLQVLVVKCNEHGARLVESLCDGMKMNKSIHDLRLKGTALGTKDAERVAQMLKKNANLRRLTLTSTCLSDDGLARICAALKGNKRIEHLDFSRNQIGAQGAKSLMEILVEKSSKVTSVNLRFNKLRDGGASRVSEILQMNNTLTSLDLTNNNIKAAGMKALAAGLEGNFSLLRLNHRQSYKQQEAAQARPEVARLEEFIRRNANRAAKEPASSGNSEEAWHCGKLMVVGPSGGGKTGLIRSLMGRQFNKDMSDTVGIEIEDVVVAEDKDEWRMYSKDTLSEGYNERIQEEKAVKAFNAALTKGNPKQLGARDLMFSVWDYGGEKVFHTVDHLFMTKLGVYVVAFSIKEYIRRDERTVAYLRFWLNSISIHSQDTPVFIVATHTDEVEAAAYGEIEGKLEAITKDMHSIVRADDDSLVFKVDNKTAVGIVDLRRALVKQLRQVAYAKRGIPLKWITALDAMRAEPGHHVEMQSAMSIMAKNDVSSVVEVVEALTLFHELGLLFHFTNTKQMSDTVILNMVWLIDEITHVIRDRVKHPIDFAEGSARRGAELEPMQKRILEQEMKILFDYALSTQHLLEFLWAKDVLFLTDLMQAHLFMTRWPWKEATYVIPAMAKSLGRARLDKDQNATIFDLFPGQPLAVFKFPYLPTGVFERLVCACIQTTLELQDGASFPATEPVIYRDAARIHFYDDCAVFLAVDKVRLETFEVQDKIWLYIENTGKQDRAEDIHRLVLQLLAELKSLMFGEAFEFRLLEQAEIDQLPVKPPLSSV